MRENTSRLDGPIRTKDAEDRRRRRGRGDGADPQSTGGRRLQLRIHAGKASILAASLAEGTARGCRDRAVEVRTLRGSDGSTIRFTKPNADRLAVRHPNVASEAIEDVILSADSVRLVDEVNEATFL